MEDKNIEAIKQEIKQLKLKIIKKEEELDKLLKIVNNEEDSMEEVEKLEI